MMRTAVLRLWEDLAQKEKAVEGELASVRNEIAATEQNTRKIADAVGKMQVELQAGPRVRLLQRAEAPRPGK
jgi:accessory colonization factor AcfC